MALFLAGCHRTSLLCRSEYLYPPYLASEQVNTPDPRRCCFFGQQVQVFWALPKSSLAKPVFLNFHVRFGNRTLQTITIPIEKRRGWWTYRLMNQDYACKEGILSFQAQLLQEARVIQEWDHFLWTTLIEIP